MPAKRDVLAEIEEIRGRMTAVDDLDSGILKLLTIVMSTEKLNDEDQEEELHAYFVVASIAAIETYFRWQVRSLIDSDNGRFLNNIRLDDLPIRLTHDVAFALIGKRLTVGELVAHTVGFSNFEQVAGFMTKLLATDFIRLVETTREADHQDVPVLNDPAQVIADVKRALELRHIICHEGQKIHSIPNSEVKQLSYSCYIFVRGCQYAVARFINPAGPTTREGAYKAASMKADALRSSLKALEETIAKDLHFKMAQDSFRAMEEAWDAYVGREGTFFASVQMNGNQGELDAVRTRVRLTERRIEELQQWLDRIGRARGSLGTPEKAEGQQSLKPGSLRNDD
jgi:hypothetical protein